jgi:hypothetical protein
MFNRVDGIVFEDVIFISPVSKLLNVMVYVVHETWDNHTLQEICMNLLQAAYEKAKPHNYN